MKRFSVNFVIALTLIAFANIAQAKSGRGVSQSEAKKACLAENSKLAGKELRKCIKKKSQR